MKNSMQAGGAPTRANGILMACLLLWMPFGPGGCAGEPEPEFSTPESVLYDADRDVYLVSNICGGAVEKDNNGFILKVSPEDGSRSEFVRAGQGGVTLNAPKGMAISQGVLWVADIDVVRKFDSGSGAPLGEVAIEGATFLNDVTVGPDGAVYCSDSGLDKDFAATGTDAVWQIATDGKVKALAKSVELGQPNGIHARDGGVYVVSWRDGTFYEIDYRGVRTDLGKAPQAKLDGLVRVEAEAAAGDGKAQKQPRWFATSWAGNAVYEFSLQGGVAAMPVRLEQAADLAYDSKRHCLVVPLFGGNRLHVERL